MKYKMFGLQKFSTFTFQYIIARRMIYNEFKNKHTLDYSNFPKIDEKDIIEQFIRGSGPGGSAVNKTSNCVLLKHITTGVVVKCHKSRILQENSKLAREALSMKVDEFLNGDMSITSQRRRIEQSKIISKKYKAEKQRTIKRVFKGQEQSPMLKEYKE